MATQNQNAKRNCRVHGRSKILQREKSSSGMAKSCRMVSERNPLFVPPPRPSPAKTVKEQRKKLVVGIAEKIPRGRASHSGTSDLKPVSRGITVDGDRRRTWCGNAIIMG
jgi:hypothetical protein